MMNLLYTLQVSKGQIVLHLSEHHGDSTPGSKAYITIDDVQSYYNEIIRNKYKFNHPGLEMAPLECSVL